MRYVRILTISGVLVACLLACAVRRSDSSLDSGRTREREELVRLTSRTDAKVSVSNTVADRWRNIKIHWRDYDTDKPADEKGNYPVKSEGWTDTSERESKDERSDVSENTLEDASVKEEAERDASHEKTENTDLDVKAGIQPLWWWLIGAFSVIVGLIFLWWKYGKKDKTK